MICGGGVVGVATAYYLSRRGVTSVIVEANGVASGASGAAAGIISPLSAEQARSPLAEIIRKGVEMHAELATHLPEESSIDYAFERRASLLIATTEEEEREGSVGDCGTDRVGFERGVVEFVGCAGAVRMDRSADPGRDVGRDSWRCSIRIGLAWRCWRPPSERVARYGADGWVASRGRAAV